MRRALLGAVALLGGCFLSHGPDGPARDGGPADGAPTACEPAPGVRLLDLDRDCRCETPYEGRLEYSERGMPLVQVCRGVPRDRPGHHFNHTGCVDGWVVPFTDPLDEHAGGETNACATGRACVYFFREVARRPDPQPCAYSDLTLARTGEIPRVECSGEQLAAGLCGIDCLCTGERRCFGLSEEHPVGACVRYRAADDGVCDAASPWCEEAGALCMLPTRPAPWIEGSTVEFFLTPRQGRCAPAPACRALEALFPDTWRCAG